MRRSPFHPSPPEARLLLAFRCPGHRGRRRVAELFEAALPDDVRGGCRERIAELREAGET